MTDTLIRTADIEYRTLEIINRTIQLLRLVGVEPLTLVGLPRLALQTVAQLENVTYPETIDIAIELLSKAQSKVMADITGKTV